MKDLLFYDTETTGRPAWSDPSDAEHQPHIVQLAVKVMDVTGENVKGGFDVIVKPEGWAIPAEVIAIHGITMERAMDEGIPEKSAVSALLDLWKPDDGTILRRVGHNESFDARIIRIALKRYYGDNDSLNALWKGGDALCTAKMSGPILKMPATDAMKKSGRSFPKTPKLIEAYRHFFGKDFEGAHSAAGDVDACLAIFFEMKRLESEANQKQAA